MADVQEQAQFLHCLRIADALEECYCQLPFVKLFERHAIALGTVQRDCQRMRVHTGNLGACQFGKCAVNGRRIGHWQSPLDLACA